MLAATVPGLRSLGSYDIVTKIAEGGMGAVYKARHQSSGRVVAIKVLPVEMSRNAVLMKRFEQEFRTASAIDHPNVVKAIDYSGMPPHPFLVMEFVPGKSCGQRIEIDGAFPHADAVSIISQVCEGLHAAHKQGIIHRDVKPDNILVTANLTAKLTDLGLVRDLDSDDNLTKTGRGLGTPYFMAPEQFRNAKNVDVRSDIYSLGATLYAIVTGRVPFDKCSPLDCWMKKTKDDFPSPESLVPGLPKRIDQTIRRAMRANPAQRQTTCREFMEDLLGERWNLNHAKGPDSQVAGPGGEPDVWYMIFYDNGFPKTVKGPTDAIRKNIQAGVLGDLSIVLVSRSKAGPFAPIKNVLEFRDLSQGDYSSAVDVAQALPQTNLSTASDCPSLPSLSGKLAGTASTVANVAHPTPPPERIQRDDAAAKLRNSESDRSERTTELPTVPMTKADNLEVRTDERPRLQTNSRMRSMKARSSDRTATSTGEPWYHSVPMPVWIVAIAVLACIVGVGLGLLLR